MTGQPSSRPMNLSACLKQVTSKPENAVKLINIILFFLLETDSLVLQPGPFDEANNINELW